MDVICANSHRPGRHQGSDRAHRRRAASTASSSSKRRPPRPARAGHRGLRAHPHLGGDRRRPARGRRRRREDRGQGPARRHLLLVGAGRPERQHDLLRSAHHPPADQRSSSPARTRRAQIKNKEKALKVLRARLYERALAEQQKEMAKRRRPGRAPATAARRSAPTTSRRRGSPTIASASPCTGCRTSSTATSTRSSTRSSPTTRRRSCSQPVRRQLTAAQALDRAVAAPGRGRSRSPPPLDAELLLRHVLGWDRAAVVARRRAVARPTGPVLRPAAVARARRRPLQHLTGVQAFWRHDFLVRPDVLIPRPETELLVEPASACSPTMVAPRVVDVGTGSGCIAVSLAGSGRTRRWSPPSTLSAAALAWSRGNAARLKLARASGSPQATS